MIQLYAVYVDRKKINDICVKPLQREIIERDFTVLACAIVSER